VAVPTAGGASAPISITIKDGNGNPLSTGTTIKATVLYPNAPVGWNITTSLTTTIPFAGYARFPGLNITDFTFTVANASTAGTVTAGQTYQVLIAVNAPGIEDVIRYFSIVMQ
jgi:hypothetical protein